MPPGLLEGLLRDIFRCARIAGDRDRDAEHNLLEAAHERDGEVSVTVPSPASSTSSDNRSASVSIVCTLSSTGGCR
jgi:hypothetical protein